MGTVLITGGAGYIGSHAVLAFKEAGYRVVVVDDLSTGRADLLPQDVKCVIGNAGDAEFIRTVIKDDDVQAVVHFAGSVVVPESVADPLAYYENNCVVSRSLIEAAIGQGVRSFIFSSTAAVYGNPQGGPVQEDAQTAPINPYGSSKLVTEWMLRDAAAAHDFRFVALRYFNVAGADPLGRTGQSTKNATHLIKVACETATGKRPEMALFGDDYPTPDGTCVRDFIHVSDLADAHVHALRYLERGGESRILNCGYGRGLSVLEVIRAVEAAAGLSIPVKHAPRRAGDSAMLVADTSSIRRALDWSPKYDCIETIVESALGWEQALAAHDGRGEDADSLQPRCAATKDDDGESRQSGVTEAGGGPPGARA